MKACARVVELADTHGLGPCAARLAGSTPVSGTNFAYAYKLPTLLQL
jgi:hypothetical protein